MFEGWDEKRLLRGEVGVKVMKVWVEERKMARK